MNIVPAKLFTVVLLVHAGELLLLCRAPWKTFAPHRWTGLGGRVEPHEFDDVGSSARRELYEETDLQPTEVSELVLRRTLTFHSPAEGLVTLVYFTGSTTSRRVPSCSEGTLAWIEPARLDQLEVIENTARILRFILDDLASHRAGIACGVAHLDEHGLIDNVMFD